MTISNLKQNFSIVMRRKQRFGAHVTLTPSGKQVEKRVKISKNRKEKKISQEIFFHEKVETFQLFLKSSVLTPESIKNEKGPILTFSAMS